MIDGRTFVGTLNGNGKVSPELSKNFLVDQDTDHKKFLQLLQSIPEHELLGLLHGTHEIRLKEKQVQNISYEHLYFQMVLESKFTVPDMDEVIACVKARWGAEMAHIQTSSSLKSGMKKTIKLFRLKKSPSSQRCVNFIQSQKSVLPNIFGLTAVAMAVDVTLPKNIPMLGFDNRNNLPALARGRLGVPSVCFHSDGVVDYDWNLWFGVWPLDYCVLSISD